VLSTAHSAADVEVFVGGTRLDPAAVTSLSATGVRVTIPPATPSGPTDFALRANKVAGPGSEMVIA
jgi:hypothetical protein